MELPGDQGRGDKGRLSALPVEAHRPRRLRRQGRALEDYGAGSVPAQPLGPIAAVRLPVQADGIIILPQQQGGLGGVGGEDVRQFRQTGHGSAHFRGVGPVGLAVVPHDGVHDDPAVRAAEGPDEVRRPHDLLPGTHKAGIHPVKGQAQALPVGRYRLHLVRQVQEGVGSKAAGMGGQVGGDHRAALDAHSGECGQDDRQRAASEGAEVMDGGNTGSGHGSGSFPYKCLYLL